MNKTWKDLFDSIGYALTFLLFIILIILSSYSIYEIIVNKNWNVLGFLGAIIGGFLTLCGVWWTINDQEKKRKEEFILIRKPIISINNPYCDLPNSDESRFRFCFTIENQGLTEATNVKMWISLYDNVNEYYIDCFPTSRNVLPPNNTISAKVIDLKIQPYSLEDGNYIGESFKINITYKDLLDNDYTVTQLVYLHLHATNKTYEEMINNCSSISCNLTNYNLKKEFTKIPKEVDSY